MPIKGDQPAPAPLDPRLVPIRVKRIMFHAGIGDGFIAQSDLRSFARTITAGPQKQWTGEVEILFEPWERAYRVTEVEGNDVRVVCFPESWAARVPEMP